MDIGRFYDTEIGALEKCGFQEYLPEEEKFSHFMMGFFPGCDISALAEAGGNMKTLLFICTWGDHCKWIWQSPSSDSLATCLVLSLAKMAVMESVSEGDSRDSFTSVKKKIRGIVSELDKGEGKESEQWMIRSVMRRRGFSETSNGRNCPEMLRRSDGISSRLIFHQEGKMNFSFILCQGLGMDWEEKEEESFADAVCDFIEHLAEVGVFIDRIPAMKGKGEKISREIGNLADILGIVIGNLKQAA